MPDQDHIWETCGLKYILPCIVHAGLESVNVNNTYNSRELENTIDHRRQWGQTQGHCRTIRTNIWLSFPVWWTRAMCSIRTGICILIQPVIIRLSGIPSYSLDNTNIRGILRVEWGQCTSWEILTIDIHNHSIPHFIPLVIYIVMTVYIFTLHAQVSRHCATLW